MRTNTVLKEEPSKQGNSMKANTVLKGGYSKQGREVNTVLKGESSEEGEELMGTKIALKDEPSKKEGGDSIETITVLNDVPSEQGRGALTGGVTTLKVVNPFVGNIESYSEGHLFGWIYEVEKPESRVEVLVYKGNSVIGNGVAKIHREDLEQSGIGDGKYGFMVPIDNSIYDGAKHVVNVVEKKTGFVLGSYEVSADYFATSRIEKIESGSLIGAVVLKKPSDAAGFDMEILVDGKVSATGVCAYDAQSAEYKFNIKIPNNFFDDCYHSYNVRLKWLLTSSNIHQEKLPSIITPWKYVSSYSHEGALSSLSKISGFRYKALQNALGRLERGEIDASQLSIMKLAHDVVVEGFENRKKFPKLILPKNSEPLISVVIPVYNKFEVTYHCIASLIMTADALPFEVVIVDDLSSDQTREISEYVENIQVVKNENNLGFLKSIEAGVKHATGEYIVLLNNDTEVTENWLSDLLSIFDSYENVGMVGAKLIYPTGLLQEAGGIVWGNGKPWNVGNKKNAEDPQYNYVRQVDYLSAAAVMLKADVWSEVNGFSQEFLPAYYEDTDFAFKVREAGYRTIYCPSAQVVHFEGMSNGKETDSGIKKFQSVNAPKFRSKWRHAYRHNGAEGVSLITEKDRNVDFRVLMVDYSVPRPDQDAGGYSAIQEMMLLQQLGCKITFVPNNMAHMGMYTYRLQKQGVECVHAPFYQSIGELLQDRGSEFDIVYITRYDVAEEIVPYIRKYSNAKIVLNNADLHFLRELRAALAAEDNNLVGALETRDRELVVMRQVDAVLSYNEVEHSVITSHNLCDKNIFKCPWVLESKRSKIPFEERNGIAFLGGFNHTPNLEAVRYFVDTVMPLLRARQPEIKFYIYGSNVTESVERLASDNVIVKGYVKSLSTVFDSCRVFVAPLLSGAGIKGKVLESVAYGVPCVLSPVAAESTGLTHGVNALIANTSDEWVSSILELYGDVDQWNAFSDASHKLVQSNYSFKNGLNAMSQLLTYLECDPQKDRPALFHIK